MAKKSVTRKQKSAQSNDPKARSGTGGELHQVAGNDIPAMTTQQGTPVADDQNSLKIGTRGPTALEDSHFREKIFHFDHERIPERVVHARGFGAHGYFENYESLGEFTRADLFQRSRISPWSCLVGWVVGESYSIYASFFESVLRPVDVHVVDLQTNQILAPGRIGSIEEVFAWHGFLSIVLVSLALFVTVTVLADFYVRSMRLHSLMLPLQFRSESDFA